MHIVVLKFVRCHNFHELLRSCRSIEVYIFYISHIYLLIIIYFSVLFTQLLKLC